MREISLLGKQWLRQEQRSSRARQTGHGRALAALLLVLVLLAGAFCACWLNYRKSDALAQKGAYSEAKDCLLVESLTGLYDKNYIPYLDAGILFERGQYGSAETSFGALGDYRDSKDMVLESRYRKASEFVDEEKFSEAIQAYADLASVSYKDSERLLAEARLQGIVRDLRALESYGSALKSFGEPGILESFDTDEWDDETKYECALALWSKERWIDSYQLLLDTGDYKDAPMLLEKLKELIYLKGTTMYLGRIDWADSLAFFRAVSPYERSEDYISLIDAKRFRLRITNPPKDRQLGENKFETSDAAIDALLKIIDFEDAAGILLDSFLDEYLVGDWESEDGSDLFKLEADPKIEDYYVEYSLPWFDFGDYFRIEDAEMLLFPEDEYYQTKQLFRFFPKTRTEMDVYCYQDGSVHTLYKK